MLSGQWANYQDKYYKYNALQHYGGGGGFNFQHRKEFLKPIQILAKRNILQNRFIHRLIYNDGKDFFKNFRYKNTENSWWDVVHNKKSTNPKNAVMPR